MDFGKKLQTLRKSRNLTQEELAEELYVSRTAISKWESGRGYPGIDSIREIASFFSVTIDELLTGEKILSIAEKENKSNIQRMCNTLFAIADLFALMLIILPLYPNTVNGAVYSVNLLNFAEISPIAIIGYWILFTMLIALGIAKFILTRLGVQKGQKLLFAGSLGVGILAVLFLILTRQIYGTITAFALLMIKGVVYLKHTKS